MSLAASVEKKVYEQLPVKEWVGPTHLVFQEKILNFLLWAYGLLLGATMLTFFLQGFRPWGFKLESGLPMWLGGATIGEKVCIGIEFYSSYRETASSTSSVLSAGAPSPVSFSRRSSLKAL